MCLFFGRFCMESVPDPLNTIEPEKKRNLARGSSLSWKPVQIGQLFPNRLLSQWKLIESIQWVAEWVTKVSCDWLEQPIGLDVTWPRSECFPFRLVTLLVRAVLMEWHVSPLKLWKCTLSKIYLHCNRIRQSRLKSSHAWLPAPPRLAIPL